ncbi:MAG TPA: glutamate ABC transporter substrate-binding protein [Actinomycetota bacterium]|nr:glutamate ABC transporter substrate-binding protein [Actinomycetota bacterium]
MIGKIQKWKWLVVMVSVVALLGAACGGGDEGDETGNGDAGQVEQYPADTTMGKIQDAGEIKVGVKYDVPLFGFKNPQTDEVEGFDVDMAQLVADKLGVDLKPVEAISDNRIPFLQDGTVDLVFSTMTITVDRDAEIDFSRPYFIAHGKILTPKDSGITGPDDLNGKKVCTALGSTYEGLIPDLAPDADLNTVDSYSECFALLQNGQTDALVTDNVIDAGFLQQDDSLAIVGPDLTTDPYGAGVKDGDTEFADFVSGVIEDSFTDGTWQELYDKWIGKYTGEEADDPSAMSLKQAFKFYPCDETC